MTPWQLIESLFQAEHQAPPLPNSADGPVPVPRTYLFEQFTGVTPDTFLAATTQLLQRYTPPADPAALPDYRRKTEYKLRTLFEYYPLCARDETDARAILDLAFSPEYPEVLRTFVIRHGAPGLESQSVFTSYLQGHLALIAAEYDEELKELVEMPQEAVPVQRAALAALLARVDRHYAALVSSDPLVVNLGKEGRRIHVRQLIDNPEAIALSRRTQVLLERKNKEVSDWATSLEALVADKNRDEALRKKASEVLAAIRRDYPITWTSPTPAAR